MARRAAAQTEEPKQVDLEEAIAEKASEASIEDHVNEATEAFKKQIEELKKSEALLRGQAETAQRNQMESRRLAEDRAAELKRIREESTQAQKDAIASGMAAAKAEAEKAQIDIQNAAEIGDFKTQAEAYRRLARAETNLARLEDGKIALETAPVEATREPTQTSDPIEDSPLAEPAKEWMRAHRDIVMDPFKNAQLNLAHHKALRAGLKEWTPAYFEFVETDIGLREPPEAAQEDEVEEKTPTKERVQVSAPVSRSDTPGQKRQSQVKLSPEEVDIAQKSGITLEEYAAQKKKMLELKANGGMS